MYMGGDVALVEVEDAVVELLSVLRVAAHLLHLRGERDEREREGERERERERCERRCVREMREGES
jgi:hypothetical protein